MKLATQNIDCLRSLSQVFTSSYFDKIVRKKDYSLIENKIKKCSSSISKESKNSTYLNFIENTYSELLSNYRCEYFFKNNLLIEYLLKKYSLSTTTVVNEFKIGNSIADFVLLNGNARIFEIKTDLDGLEKLNKQLTDYKQFADQVYIVTSSKFIDKLIVEYSNSTVGIVEFTARNTFKEHKKAESNLAYFDSLTIFKTLRKAEYLEITKNAFGFIPDVPNTKIFKACFELINTLELLKKDKLKIH